jgi:L-cystine uptake protein TcyP (sodium:dicarboxylate symporter family)
MLSTPQPSTDVTNRDAAEWGLAALLLAGFQMLLVPGIILIAIFIWAMLRNDHDIGALDGLLISWLCRVGVIVALVGCTTTLVIALRAGRVAANTRASTALPLAGLILALVNLLLWILATITLLYASENFLRVVYRRG